MDHGDPDLDKGLIVIQIGGEDYQKPYDPQCLACVSEFALQIDAWLAAGYNLEAIRGRLRARRALVVPKAQELEAHVAHLAPPHQAARERLARAGEPDHTALTLEDVNAVVIQRALTALAEGGLAMQPDMKDLNRALRLQLQIETVRAGQAAGVSREEIAQAFEEFLWIARKHLAGPKWDAFRTEIEKSASFQALVAVEDAPVPEAGEGT